MEIKKYMVGIWVRQLLLLHLAAKFVLRADEQNVVLLANLVDKSFCPSADVAKKKLLSLSFEQILSVFCDQPV